MWGRLSRKGLTVRLGEEEATAVKALAEYYGEKNDARAIMRALREFASLHADAAFEDFADTLDSVMPAPDGLEYRCTETGTVEPRKLTLNASTLRVVAHRFGSWEGRARALAAATWQTDPGDIEVERVILGRTDAEMDEINKRFGPF